MYQSQSDLLLALLAFRNTPTKTLQASLAQMLFGRCTKTSLSTNEQLLRPHIPARIEQKQQTAKAKQATTYNRAARDLSELLPGQTVHIQLFKSGEWKKTVVSKVLSNRSYKVITKQGSVYRRNRHHLRHSNETSPASTIVPLASEDVELEQPLIVTTSSLQTSTPTRIQPTTMNSEVKGNVHG